MDLNRCATHFNYAYQNNVFIIGIEKLLLLSKANIIVFLWQSEMTDEMNCQIDN